MRQCAHLLLLVIIMKLWNQIEFNYNILWWEKEKMGVILVVFFCKAFSKLFYSKVFLSTFFCFVAYFSFFKILSFEKRNSYLVSSYIWSSFIKRNASVKIEIDKHNISQLNCILWHNCQYVLLDLLIKDSSSFKI